MQLRIFDNASPVQAGIINVYNGKTTVGFSGLLEEQAVAMRRLEQENVTDLDKINSVLSSVGLYVRQ